MPKICDNTSVGQIIRQDGSFLMIKRLNYPESFAFVAGHGDGLALEAAAKKESMEEVGIEIIENKLVWKGTINNLCKREGGDYHMWEVFEAISWTGEPKAGDDAKEFFWALSERLVQLANRTEYFMKKYDISYDRVADLTRAISVDPQWRGDMGLEPVWYFILKELKIL